jgi:hypothetical protein
MNAVNKEKKRILVNLGSHRIHQDPRKLIKKREELDPRIPAEKEKASSGYHDLGEF